MPSPLWALFCELTEYDVIFQITYFCCARVHDIDLYKSHKSRYRFVQNEWKFYQGKDSKINILIMETASNRMSLYLCIHINEQFMCINWTFVFSIVPPHPRGSHIWYPHLPMSKFIHPHWHPTDYDLEYSIIKTKP